MIFIPCVEMFGPKVELVNIFFCELSNKYQVRMADLESNGAKINITNRGREWMTSIPTKFWSPWSEC